MEAALPKAQAAGAKKILEIRLKIGEISGVLPECIEHYFRLISTGTIAEGAQIVTQTIPVRVSCPECGYEGEMKKGQFACPGCGGTAFRITAGREYFVDSLKVE